MSEITEGGLTQLSDSFSAYGARRDPGDRAGPIATNTDRGYTFHSNLDRSDLVYMNGRVMDATLGRFPSADPYVQASGFTQSLNR